MRRTVTITALTIGLLWVPSSADAASPESQVVEMINQERAQRGYRNLVVRNDLSQIAERHSQRMQQRAEIYHNKRLGDEIPGSWDRAGENVGVGGDIYMLHEAFMASAQHRANILGGYNEIGVGVVVDPSGETYVTQVFVQRSTSGSSSSSSGSSSSGSSKSKPSSGSSSSNTSGDPEENTTETKSAPKSSSKPSPAAGSSSNSVGGTGSGDQPASQPTSEPPASEPEPSTPSRAVDLLLRVVTFK